MRDLEFSEAVKSMRNRTTRLEHEGDYWSQEERDRLEYLFYTGVGITAIAIQLQRTEPAVAQQIEKLDLYQRKLNQQRKRSSKGNYGCLCGRCELYPKCCPRLRASVDRQEDD